MTAVLAARVCGHCGTELSRREDEKAYAFGRRRYCNARCASDSRRILDITVRTCGTCGEPFPRRKGETSGEYVRRCFCSKSCRATGMNLTRRGERHGPPALPSGVRPDELTWRLQGACRDVDPELFYPDSRDGGVRIAEAAAVCAGCPVRAQCREWGLQRELHGIWGGLTENDRHAIRSRREPAA